MYTAAVLSPTSQSLLKEILKGLCPNSFEWVGHHCTLHMGPPLPTDRLNETVMLVATHFAKNDKVCAVKIGQGGDISSNKTPHVTVAVNRTNGGKPKDSNELTGWVPLKDLIDSPFIVLISTVEECR